MIPVSLYGENFLSFEKIEYDFVSKPLLILGVNKTNRGQKSNGSGKTALQNIFEYCLYGSVSRKVTDKKLVRRGQKNSDIGLNIYCPVRNETIFIERSVFVKGSSKLEILIKEGRMLFSDLTKEDRKLCRVSYAEIKDGNNFILKWFGITKEDLQNYFILNKDRYTSFFSASEREKIELISRFSNANIISGVEKYVDTDVEKKQSEIDDVVTQKNKIGGSIETLKEELEKEKERDLEGERERLIVQAKNSIDEYKEEDVGDLRKINTNKKVIEDLTRDLSSTQEKLKNLLVKQESFDKTSFDKEKEGLRINIKSITDSKKNVDKSLSNFEKERREMVNELSTIEKNLAGTVRCPKCSHEFSISDPNIDVSEEKEVKLEVEKVLIDIKSDMLKLEKNIEEKNTQITSIEKSLNLIKNEEITQAKEEDALRLSIKSIKDSVFEIEEDILSKKRSNSTLIKAIENRSESAKRILEHIKSLKSQKLENVRIGGLEESIKDLESNLEVSEKSISILNVELFEISQWIFNLKKFHQHLALKSLKVIEGRININLNELNSDLQVKLEGFKLKSNGDISEKITPYVLDGGNEEDFGSYSGGERARIEFAVILAVQDMVNSSHPYGGFQFLSIDEVMERVDDEGLGAIMKSLSNFEMPIWVTTHVSDDKVFNDVLKIEKVNNISRILN